VRPAESRRRRWVTPLIVLLAMTASAECGGGGGGDRSASGSTSTSTTASTSTPTTAGSTSVDRHALPLGDDKVSSTPAVGRLDSCETSFGGGGSFRDGPWITGSTWDLDAKLHVRGDVAWPQASLATEVRGADRRITTMGVPIGHGTGTFPVATDDPAFAYDRNPNRIQARTSESTIPAHPELAAEPTCLGLGPIGVLTDGVVLFNALDAGGRDAAAHEVLDACDGHPERSGTYHPHTVPSCVLAATSESSVLVGYASDGFGIFVERRDDGSLPTNADLDECHGRTSEILWDGQRTAMYHYVATLEFPYTVGCLRGTPGHIAG
jgi:hypothetical protein